MEEKSLVGSWIRQTTRGKKRYYSVIDAIAGITNSKNPRDYWYRVKKRQITNCGIDLSTVCRQLRLQGPDGKYYLTDCADQEGMGLILRNLPAKVSGPLLRREAYTVEDLQKDLLKKKADEELESAAGSCRQTQKAEPQVLRRKKCFPAEHPPGRESTSLHSAELWTRFYRTLYHFLKALYNL